MTDSPFRAFSAKIVGITPYSQSKMLFIPRDKGEDWAAWEARVWRDKMHTMAVDGVKVMAIPGDAIRQCVCEYAAQVGERIEGKGMKTWKKPFVTGVRVFNDVPTNAVVDGDKSVLYSETNMCDAQGGKGSAGGSRVPRTFPCIPQGWTANPLFLIVDDLISVSKFTEYLERSGYQIGVGRWRPQNGGSKGMFRVESVESVDPADAMGIT